MAYTPMALNLEIHLQKVQQVSFMLCKTINKA